MSYFSNIPQATDIPANSQPQILANFKALAPFGNGYVDLTVQSGTQPPPLFSTTDTALYNYSYTATGSIVANNETFIQTQVNGGASRAQIPMTASALSNSTLGAGDAGWTYLPSGILLKWGTVAVTMANQPTSMNADSLSKGPAFTQVLNIQLTAQCTGSIVATSAYLTGGVSAATTVALTGVNANTVVNYLFIGY
jgi:hypothetical protein